MAIRVQQGGPLAGSQVVTPSEQISSELVEMGAEDLSPVVPRSAEEEYFNTPPSVPAPTSSSAVSQQAIQEEDTTAGLQEMYPQDELVDVRNNYIDTFESVYGQQPRLSNEQAVNAGYLMEETSKLNQLLELRRQEEEALASQQMELEEVANLPKLSQRYKDSYELNQTFNFDLPDKTLKGVANLRTKLSDVMANSTFAITSQQATGDTELVRSSVLDQAVSSFGLTNDLEGKTAAVNTVTAALSTLLSTSHATKYDNLTKEKDDDSFGMDEETSEVALKNKDLQEYQEPSYEDTRNMLAVALSKLARGAEAADQLAGASERDVMLPAMGMLADSLMAIAFDPSMNLYQTFTDSAGVVRARKTPYATTAYSVLSPYVRQLNKAAGAVTTSTPISHDSDPFKSLLYKVREGHFKRPTKNGIAEIAPQYKLAALIHGNMGLQVDYKALYTYQLLAKSAFREAEQNADEIDMYRGNPEAQENRRKELKNNQKDSPDSFLNLFKGEGLSVNDPAFQVLARDIGYDFEVLVDNATNKYSLMRHGKFRIDVTVGRSYADSNLNPQRSKTMRGVVVHPHTLQVDTKPFKALTKNELDKFFQDTAALVEKKEKPEPSSKKAELDFLFTVAFNSATDIDNKDPYVIFSELTPETLFDLGRIGGVLDSFLNISLMGANKNNLTKFLDPQTMPDLFTLADSEKGKAFAQAISELRNKYGANRENFGFKFQTAISVFKYLEAKKAGTAFQSTMLYAGDLHSAGRSYAEMDRGNIEYAKSVGIIRDVQKEIFDPFTRKEELPRPSFMQEVKLKMALEGDPEVGLAFENLLNKYYAKHGIDFADAFGKSPLMTTDYGKATRYHLEPAKKLLNRYPDFEEDLISILQIKNGSATRYDALKYLMRSYDVGLNALFDIGYLSYLKDMSMLLGMGNRSLNINDFFGGQIALGGNIQLETPESVEVETPSGRKVISKVMESVFSASASAKGKIIQVDNEDLKQFVLEAYDPGPGSKIKNAVLPATGQSRESATVTLTTLLNADKKPEDYYFMYPVFDNFIMNSESAPYVMHYVNNVAAPKVFEWDLYKNILNDANQQIKDMQTGLDAEPDKKQFIRFGHQYFLALYNTDTLVNYAMQSIEKLEKKQKRNTDENRKLERDKQLISELKNKVPSYSYVKDRHNTNEIFVLTNKEIKSLMSIFYNYKNIKNKQTNIKFLLENDRPQALRLMKETAKSNRAAFFT